MQLPRVNAEEFQGKAGKAELGQVFWLWSKGPQSKVCIMSYQKFPVPLLPQRYGIRRYLLGSHFCQFEHARLTWSSAQLTSLLSLDVTLSTVYQIIDCHFCHFVNPCRGCLHSQLTCRGQLIHQPSLRVSSTDAGQTRSTLGFSTGSSCSQE